MAILAIAWATSLNRTPVAQAIAVAISTALRSMAAAIASKYVMRIIDQSNCENAFRIYPTSFNITLLIDWFYPGEYQIMERQYIISYSPGYRHKQTRSMCSHNFILDVGLGNSLIALEAHCLVMRESPGSACESTASGNPGAV